MALNFVSSIVIAGSMFAASCSSSVTATRTFNVSSELLKDATVASNEQTSLDVEARNGWIELRADPDAPSIEVEARFQGRARDEEEAQRRAELMDVEVDWNDEGVLVVRPVIRAEGKEGEWKNGEGVSFKIVVPMLENAKLVSSNGAIDAFGVRGTCTIETSNGTVELGDCQGDTFVTTSNGKVQVANQIGSIDIATSNGGIFASFGDGFAHTFELETSNGPVELDIPGEWSGEVAANTSNGRIRMTGSGPSVDSKRSSATFVLGSGGPRSTVETSNGSVTIHAR